MDLNGPGMTLAHRVGLAGLWMTLRAVERDRREEPARQALQAAGGDWDLSTTAVVLRWRGGFGPFWEALRAQAFRIDSEGMVWLPALGRPEDSREQACLRQWALLNSILQHPQTRKADSLAKPASLALATDEGLPLILRFPRVRHYAHQDAEVRLSGPNPVKGWHLPGGAERHVGLGTTALLEPAVRFLPLLFLPAGALYFEAVLRRADGLHSAYALVLPEVCDLRAYARAADGQLGGTARRLHVAGASEAAARALTWLNAAERMQELDDWAGPASCRVLLFGGVPWSQQRSRIDAVTAVRPQEAGARRVFAHVFRSDEGPFPVRRIEPKGGDAFWDVPQTPELLARNLLAGRPWWIGFAGFVADSARGVHVMRWESEGVGQMLDDMAGAEHRFVMACQEAWGMRAARLGERARDETGQRDGERQRDLFGKLYEREFSRVRVLMLRCKNAANFRDAIAEFWSGAGKALPTLQEHWAEVLPLLGDKRWREGRDLALVALTSYRSRHGDPAALGEQAADDVEGNGG